MRIKNLRIKNYRLLKDISLSLSDTSTAIVGRNNTGKTSLTEIFRSFLSDKVPGLKYEDFNMDTLKDFEKALDAYRADNDNPDIRKLIPSIELELLLDYTDDQEEYGVLGDFILDLDEEQTETIVLIRYQLKDGKIKPFFEGLNPGTPAEYFKELKERISTYFEAKLFAIDPKDRDNKKSLDFTKVRKLLFADFINAQRGLDDETHNEKDVLGKSLGNIFKSASLESASDDFRIKSESINKVFDELQGKVDSEFQSKVKELLPTLELFGYPGLKDPNLSAATELNVKSLLENNTRVYYQKDSHFTLPETYNGLGFRNLIFILFRIYEFFRKYQSAEQTPKGHIIFIEEPEAHLHPQMQEVFIRQLDKIVQAFEQTLNSNIKWPVQFVVSTHSTHIANEVEFNKVRYFLSKDDSGTQVKDLSTVFDLEADKADKDFIHKYMTLTKCDLYFADKAILIEGATERILMPEILKKTDEKHATNLRKNYMSIVEIGGAYAHHFYKFIDFLELKTLVITDLDSTKSTTKPDKNGVNRPSNSACPVASGTHSSNVGISKWFNAQSGYMTLPEIQAKSDADKVQNCRRLAFQVPEEGSTYCARSFEDAFVLANLTLFGLQDGDNVGKEAFAEAKKIGTSSKANFAIEYAVEKIDWGVPKYIEDGLIWLSKESTPPINDLQGEAE